MAYTLVILKPDCSERRLTLELTQHLERAGKVVRLNASVLTEDQVAALYDKYKDADFFPRLLTTMTSGPTTQMILQGEIDICSDVRTLAIHLREYWRDPNETNRAKNLIHATEYPVEVAREINIFFPGFLDGVR